MSEFLQRLGRMSALHPFRTLGVWLVVAVAVFAAAAGLGGETVDDFRVPGVESQAAQDALKARFPTQAGGSGRLVFHVDRGRIDEGDARAQVEAALAALAEGRDVTVVTDPFDARGPAVSPDGRTAFVDVQYDVQTPQRHHYDDVVRAISPVRDAGVQAEISGSLARTARAIEGQEGVGLAVAILVLLVAFGSVIAMGIPIGTALLGVAVGLGGIGVLASAFNVPTVSEMLGTMIGLGVGIDYALFVVTRHRQHLHDGMSVADAAGQATATAGQSVLFAGTTVIIAISGLAISGIPSITTMGAAVAIVVIVAMLLAVTALPALLGLAGRRIDALAVHRRRTTDDARRTVSGRWAQHIGHRPWPYAVVTVVLLVVLAAPVTALRIAFADDGNAAPGTTDRRAYDLLAGAFGPGFNAPLTVVVEAASAGDGSAVDRVRSGLASTPGIVSVAPPVLNESRDTAVLIATPATGPQDPVTSEVLSHLREQVLPLAVSGTEARALVTGQTAFFDDVSQRLTDRLPLFIGAVVALSFVLLTIVFRSVFVPLKAALMNLLSIGAAYGVVVAVFQWGWGKGIVGLDAAVPVNPFVPLVMFAILFGLSMDYEVFLLSRVREEYVRTGDSQASVVDGLGSTARVITSAALIMVSVFLAFVPASDVTVKMFGVGLATAVLLDATLVRMVLVPATMAILGDANWWLPRWLDRMLPRLDVEGAGRHAGEGAPEHERLAA